MTKQGPPRRLETMVAALTPPARREEVLGDLYERYAGPARYMRDAVRTVPLVLASEIWRSTNPGAVLLEALALYFSFFVGMARDRSPFLEHPVFLRILFPVLAALTGLRLADVYLEGERVRRSILRAEVGVAFAYASEGVLFAIHSSLIPTIWVVARDGAFALLLLSLLGMYLPWIDPNSTRASPASDEAMKRATRGDHPEFQVPSDRRRAWAYLGAAFVFLTFGVLFLEAHNLGIRLGAALILFAGVWRLVGKSRTGSRAKPTN